MDKRTITDRRETGGSGYSQQPTSRTSKRTMSVLMAGLIVCAFHCRFFQTTALSQTNEKQQTTSIASNPKEPIIPALSPEQKIATLKREELELAERLMKEFPNSRTPNVPTSIKA